MKKDIQPIIMIGAMKAGTTTVYEHLRMHPQICMPPQKEPEYFSKRFGKSIYKVEDYYSLFKLNKTHRYTFEGSTGYTKFPLESGIPERIYNYGLYPKFIYIVRNPFDRIQSHFNFMKKDLTWKSTITSDHLIRVSNYYRQLEEYRKYFSKQNFLILDFDELKNDYRSVIKRVYDFVGIQDYVFAESKIHSNKTSKTDRKAIKIKSKLGEMNFISGKTRKFLKKTFFKYEYRKLTAKEHKYVYEQLKPDMLLFEKEYGIDVSRWGFYE